MSILARRGAEPAWFPRQQLERKLTDLAKTPVRLVSASTIIGNSDAIVLVDATAGAVTISLPPLSGNQGVIFNVKKMDSSGNAVTLDGDGSETIDGSPTLSTTTQYASYTVVGGPNEWSVI